MDLRRQLTEDVLALCRIPSPYGHEQALADHLEAWGRRHFDSVVRSGHSLVLGRPDPARPTVALVGHIDTVPGHEGDAEPHLEDGRIVGLGSSDMKSGLAVALRLVEDLDLAALPYGLVVIFYDREEGPHEESGLKRLLAEHAWLREIELAFVLEPTDRVVQIGCLGSIHATVTFEGQRAHSARPWHGENAVTKAGAFLAELHDRAPVPVVFAGQTFQEVVTVTRAEGGLFRNVVPDRFELNVNYRFAPGKGTEAATAELEALVAGRATVEYTDLAPSGAVPEGSALFERFLETSGCALAPKQAWTDVARLTEAGIDAVNYGPGRTDQAHQRGEFCEVDDVVACYEALRAFLAPAT